jgi:hypothetical protein
MLSLNDLLSIVDEVDGDDILEPMARDEWINSCLLMVQSAESDRPRVSQDGYDLDTFIRAQIEECTLEVIQTIKSGHSSAYAVLYGEEIAKEDHERATYAAYEKLRRIGEAFGNKGSIFAEAYQFILKEGKSEIYARRYAQRMGDEPWDGYARECASSYEDAFLEASHEGKSEPYSLKFSEMVGNRDYARSYCRLYAKTWEEATSLYSDSRDVEAFARYFSDEFYDYSSRCDQPELDEFYYFDRARAYVEAVKIFGGRDAKVAQYYIDVFMASFSDYPIGRDNKESIMQAFENARNHTQKYLERLHQKDKPQNC